MKLQATDIFIKAVYTNGSIKKPIHRKVIDMPGGKVQYKVISGRGAGRISVCTMRSFLRWTTGRVI